MRDLTARAYMVSRLDGNQLRVLHSRENELGYPGTTSVIRKKFNLSEIGEVPEELYSNAESQVIAVNEKARADYKGRHTGCCFPLDDGMYPRSDARCPSNPYLAVLHAGDLKIIDDGVCFPTPTTGGKAREKMMKKFDPVA